MKKTELGNVWPDFEDPDPLPDLPPGDNIDLVILTFNNLLGVKRKKVKTSIG